MKRVNCVLIGFIFLQQGLLSQAVSSDLIYLGQEPPYLIPQIFAPGFISKENEYEFGSVFNKSGDEFFYGVELGTRTEIRYSRILENEWTVPVTILSNPSFGFNDPFLSPDGQRLYFISRRSMDGKGVKDDYDIWYVKRNKTGWSEPVNAGNAINSSRNEYYISFTKEGTMYFSSNKDAAEENYNNFDVYFSKMKNGEFQRAIKLSDAVNTPHYEADVFVDPDEDYLIFCANRPKGYGRGDLYVSFRQSDGTWTKSINMGDVINSDKHELCPYVSENGKYLFYTSNQDIYWVSTEILKDLDPRK